VAGPFRSALGSSVVEEFVAGHSSSDVLRELVQNEYDGKGTQLAVEFGSEGVHVSGTGETINEPGWRRLQVLLGTGRVIGSAGEEPIQPKMNGVGSKNFGLRSLFLFGNRIHVRSGGQMAVLDLPELGTQRLPDPASRNRKGVTIFVPYRTARFQTLEPFSPERERAALDGIAEDLLHTMVKLVTPGSRHSLTAVTVLSERNSRKLSWRQNALPIRCRMKGVRGFRRVAHFSDTTSDRTHVFEELEFQQTLQIPEQYRNKNFPTYFRVANERLRIGVSVPLKRGRILRSRLGRFYYPLAIKTGFTGSAVSVSAPFDVDADRTSLIESDWNSWLAEEAAKLTIELLSHDWLRRFGAEAYLALTSESTASPASFAEKTSELLRTTECWPSQSRVDGHAFFRKAKDLAFAEHAPLERFLDHAEVLDSRLSSRKDARDFAKQCGSRTFTINSLVRLRCGPQKATLATKLNADEANYHYTDYDTSLRNPETQSRMASALTELSIRLSNLNRRDLRETASTLAADGFLQPASNLFRIDRSIWDVCPVPLSERLHPDLLSYSGIARFSKTFAIDDWVRGVAERCRDGTTTDQERAAAYQYLLTRGSTLKNATIAAVRHSPIVKDHRNGWIAPASLISSHAKYFGDLEPALSAPSEELERAVEIIRCLRIREKISGADLTRCAAFVSNNPELSERFENVLSRVPQLLTAATVKQLSHIAFLRSTRGELATVDAVHQRSPITLACLEPEDGFVTGTNTKLYRRLGCPDRPTSTALLGGLARWRTSGRAPADVVRFYTALVDALHRERLSPAAHKNEPILWMGGTYCCPEDTLVGKEFPRCFRSAVPQVRSPDALCQAFAALGAHAQPTVAHWIRLVASFGSRYESGAVVVSNDRVALMSMYRILAERGLPDGAPEEAACLLDDKGAVYSLSDLRNGRFIENDYPELAAELRKASAEIAFAEISEGTSSFFTALGLRTLSDVVLRTDIRTGDERHAPAWLRGTFAEREIAKFKRDDFLGALSAIATSFQRRNGHVVLCTQSELRLRIAEIQRISFVDEIVQVCRVAASTVHVPVEIATVEDCIFLVPVRSRPEFDQLLALTIAELLGAKAIVDVRSLQTLVLPLLQCKTEKEIDAYLRRQGVVWRHTEDEESAIADETQDFDEEASEDVSQDVIQQLVDDLQSHGETPDEIPPTPAEPAQHKENTRPPIELPPLDNVRLTIAGAGVSWTAPSVKMRRRGWRSGSDFWPAPEDVTQDLLIGDRGEELVYRSELERVRGLGYEAPERYVIWTSRNDAGADHDIRSVTDDGGLLWIEVKSTTGTDGWFYWPKREFEKALRERERYELWRVYESHTTRPMAKCFRDPISLLNRNALRLELGTLRAVIEPLENKS
jgi:hypothetical protein